MDMTLSSDHAFLQFYFARGSNQLAAWRAGDISGFPDGSRDTDLSGVSQRELYLRSRADRP